MVLSASPSLFVPTLGLRRINEHWLECRDGNESARSLFHRHYSYRPYADGRQPKLFVGPGEKVILISAAMDALFVWRKFLSADGQQGINCAVFRNESSVLASELILAAEEVAHGRWGFQRMFTYVDARWIQSSNPGYCFQRAGWRKVGITKNRKLIILAKGDEGCPAESEH